MKSAFRDAMGFLTRWIASGIDDGAKRDAALRAHITSTTAKCDALCVRRREATRRDARDASRPRDRSGSARRVFKRTRARVSFGSSASNGSNG